MKSCSTGGGPITHNFKQYVPKQTTIKLSSDHQQKVKKLGHSPVTVEEMQVLFNFKGNGSSLTRSKHSRSQSSLMGGGS